MVKVGVNMTLDSKLEGLLWIDGGNLCEPDLVHAWSATAGVLSWTTTSGFIGQADIKLQVATIRRTF